MNIIRVVNRSRYDGAWTWKLYRETRFDHRFPRTNNLYEFGFFCLTPEVDF